MNPIDELEGVISDIECGQSNAVSIRSLRRVAAEIDLLRSALVDARDTFAGDENDDRYWAWFNRHESGAFSGLTTERSKP